MSSKRRVIIESSEEEEVEQEQSEEKKPRVRLDSSEEDSDDSEYVPQRDASPVRSTVPEEQSPVPGSQSAHDDESSEQENDE